MPGAADQEAPADHAVPASADREEARGSTARKLKAREMETRREIPSSSLNKAVVFRLGRSIFLGKGGDLALCRTGRDCSSGKCDDEEQNGELVHLHGGLHRSGLSDGCRFKSGHRPCMQDCSSTESDRPIRRGGLRRPMSRHLRGLSRVPERNRRSRREKRELHSRETARDSGLFDVSVDHSALSASGTSVAS